MCRLSAVIGRPGWSNSISYPYTGIFTQPLEGKDYACPLPMEIPYPCSALNNNVAGLLFLGSKVDSAVTPDPSPGPLNRHFLESIARTPRLRADCYCVGRANI